ncbi:MUG60 [Hepatospora eriocheir]|uniref:MUG60 n=1 Tax=Hepatospora eriocheir TaxID=1081669 RepID=A0A1X0QI11_9MICR|nr:MUG60 [Hepatospora eriocheir]
MNYSHISFKIPKSNNQTYNLIKISLLKQSYDIKEFEKEVDGLKIKLYMDYNIENLIKIFKSILSSYENTNICFERRNKCNKKENVLVMEDTDLLKLCICLVMEIKNLSKKLSKYNANIYIDKNKVRILSDTKGNLYEITNEIMLYFNHYFIVYFSFNKPFNQLNKQILVTNNNKVTLITNLSDLNRLTCYEARLETNFNLNKETTEFICGKKCGKFNKIVNDVKIPVTLSFKNNQTYFSVEPTCFTKFVKGLNLLFDEYPYIELFNIDQKYHKKIIGVSGVDIQKLMKVYDVYIKFMNNIESVDYNYNVICKTPIKNMNNIENLKKELLSLTNNSQLKKENKSINILPKKENKNYDSGLRLLRELIHLYKLIN